MQLLIGRKHREEFIKRLKIRFGNFALAGKARAEIAPRRSEGRRRLRARKLPGPGPAGDEADDIVLVGILIVEKRLQPMRGHGVADARIIRQCLCGDFENRQPQLVFEDQCG